MESENKSEQIKSSAEFPSFVGGETVKPREQETPQAEASKDEPALETPQETAGEIGEAASIVEQVAPVENAVVVKKNDSNLSEALVDHSADSVSEAHQMMDLVSSEQEKKDFLNNEIL